MAVFTYRAKKITGEETEGREEAADRFALAAALRKKGYFLISSREARTAASRGPLLSFLGHVSLAEKMMFARNLSVMSGAGVSIVKSLDVLARETQSGRFSKALADLSVAVTKGKSLSQAMEENPALFSKLFRAMVRAGEASGRLEESLKLVAMQMERDYDLIRKVRGAFMYPAIILAAMVAIGILMLIFVVPTLLQTFEELDVEIPATTQFIVSVSSFFLNHSILASVLSLAVIGAGVGAVLSARGRQIVGIVLLRLPVISGIVKKVNAARTARTLSSLIGSGVEIMEALSVTTDVVQNPRFKRVLEESRSEIQKGNPISAVFIKHSHLYPVVVGEMIAVGEETGKLSEMLERLAVFFEEEVAEETKSLATVIEPFLMIIIGAIVGFFAISMIQPIYSVVGGI
ncbi:MAG: type II secretion system F family protein [Candidatus Niyogibacteria bacterium]|nr:type II secretion system F family protein [Candidatus Niyogibacteria bacterium]